jgi:hypothetical protein
MNIETFRALKGNEELYRMTVNGLTAVMKAERVTKEEIIEECTKDSLLNTVLFDGESVRLSRLERIISNIREITADMRADNEAFIKRQLT